MRPVAGSVLVVDVGRRAVERRPLPPDWRDAFVGGTGLATRLLWDLVPAGAEPLGAANAVVFASAPLVGTPITTTSKFAVATKSPLTGFLGDSLSSSQFAIELKRTGVDALAIVGAADRWVVPVVRDGVVDFVDAEAGLSPAATADRFRAAEGDDLAIAAIGPAGERLVRFATLTNDGRVAGRSGLGAVLGAKRVKAVAVRGTGEAAVADEPRLRAIASDLRERSLGPATAKYRHVGTVANMLTFDRLGVLPTRNFQASRFDGADRVSGETLQASRHVGREYCTNCTIGCTHIFAPPEGDPVRLEYETAFALGPLVGIDDPDILLAAARLCDDLGMDSISAGGTIAWAMESVERGVLRADLRFGDAESLLRGLRAIASREGVGDLLADGSRRAAAKVGGGSAEWALHVKGMELPGYDPRALPALALGFAVGTRGACHNRSGAYEIDFATEPADDPIRAAIDTENLMAAMDSLIVCKFLRKCFTDFFVETADALEAVTGRRVDLRLAGERIHTLKKLFNVREGWNAADDALPARVTPPGLEARIRDYYRARGWEEDGRIGTATLDRLGLTGFAMTARPA